jgi:hypothetical protein
VAERLRRWIATLLCSASVHSNPILLVLLLTIFWFRCSEWSKFAVHYKKLTKSRKTTQNSSIQKVRGLHLYSIWSIAACGMHGTNGYLWLVYKSLRRTKFANFNTVQCGGILLENLKPPRWSDCQAVHLHLNSPSSYLGTFFQKESFILSCCSSVSCWKKLLLFGGFGRNVNLAATNPFVPETGEMKKIGDDARLELWHVPRTLPR